MLVLKKVSYLLNLARIQLHQAKHKFFSFRTSAITSMLSKQFKGAGRHPAPGGGASSSSRGGESSSSRGGASSSSRGRGVIQLQGAGRHAVGDLQQGWRSGGRGHEWIPNNVRLCIGKAGRDEYQRASGKRVQLWKETARLEVTPLSFGKWGLRHRKRCGWGGFGSEEPH